MILLIEDVLPSPVLRAVSDTAQALPEFVDGAATAGHAARQVKDNEQASGRVARQVLEQVQRRLMSHPVIRAAALPHRCIRLLLSRYQAGMAYGIHTDNALIDGARTDLSFTLMLDSGQPHRGGELTLCETSGDRSWKLEPGQMLLYPSTYLHRVEPVIEGTRLVVVGWIQSRVRDPWQRELLFNLQQAVEEERTARGKTPQYDRLDHVRQNLIRLWADGASGDRPQGD